MTTNTKPKNILITGVSSGFGRAFATAAIAEGHHVIGTVRKQTDLAAFTALSPAQTTGIILDVTDFDAIPGAIKQIETDIGPIDVLINNAGYGHEGLLEESPLAELEAQFRVNVFGAVAMIKAVLPHMRQRRRGHILNVTSMGGFITMPGISYYCGSKFALEGISETLASEVAGLGIHVTAIEPGSFRTDWAGRSMVRSDRSISDYDALFDPIRDARQKKSGNQAGDPAKAAKAVMDILTAPNPPVHLLLGRDALSLVRTKLDDLQTEFTQWEHVTTSTDFDA
ncbi:MULTISPECIES: oxidoreductase [Thalassospira]|nr:MULTISPECIES: oxidoreductase [Thalassospira]MAB33596.1 oxidoreductase [Thalassospira sp.]MDM7978628.1 oxidoreductase [Thalassospira xiamenensis]OHZ01662.1 short-chain dehydrogenase/reductase [Thalassospira sp. MIT1004]HBS25040.1 oxidoreductase [Thalassospira sp.]|tara:strand:- start:1882 stop:2730 length:849 start_codon:yes stop_codon:yes gene_type:complete